MPDDQLDRDLQAEFVALLDRPAYQIDLEDWLHGKRDDDAKQGLAREMVKIARQVLEKPH